MRNLLRKIVPLTVLCVAFAALAAGAAGAADEPDGAALFKQKCSMCHAVDGKGFTALKTPDFTDPKWQASLTDEQITAVIKNGKKDTMMQAFGDKLKDDEIEALVKQIRSFNAAPKK